MRLERVSRLASLAAILAGGITVSAEPNAPQQNEVFVAGHGGYHTYRIPALLVTPKGTVLAFCEGRKGGQGDSGNIDLVLKRSLDGGATWQPMQTVWDDGPNTCGNPCPVYDRDTNTIWLPLTHNLGKDSERQIMDGTSTGTRTVWITKSTDEGATWSAPVEITQSTKEKDWTWYATGPGCGIQMTSGRLVIPCDHAVAKTKAWRSHAFFSDDHGATWKLGGVSGEKCNECQVVELADGSLLLNMRAYHSKRCRAIATSKDGGVTWSEVAHDAALVEPVCQAAFIRYTPGATNQELRAKRQELGAKSQEPRAKSRLLFSNPASPKREKLTLKLSYDEGKTWPVARELHAGPAAYSALSALGDGTILCLYERGEKNPYERITLARMTLEWLSSGADKLK